jgi:hypothetical protein
MLKVKGHMAKLKGKVSRVRQIKKFDFGLFKKFTKKFTFDL